MEALHGDWDRLPDEPLHDGSTLPEVPDLSGIQADAASIVAWREKCQDPSDGLYATLGKHLTWLENLDTALADPTATTVVYMGRRTFAALADRLIAHGLPPDTQALLAEAVGHPHQTLLRASVAELAAMLPGTASPHPALILYGPLAETP